jgi:hypothetical protein
MYYVYHKSTVLTFLDATKVFDRVHYCKLFELLINNLISFYVDTLVKVSWIGSDSDFKFAFNEMKQVAFKPRFVLYLYGRFVIAVITSCMASVAV